MGTALQNTRVKADSSYYAQLRMPLLGLIRGRPKRVLEIGCGHGQALSFLKCQQIAEFVVGVELVPEVAAIARQNPKLDMVLTGDAEEMQFDFPREHFDLIIASHVLEHLRDPWHFARRLRTMLHPAGQFIGSLPNVRYGRVSLPLVFFGKFQYAEEGILDWTHTRFFTESTIRDLLESSGFVVERIEPEFYPRGVIANRMTLGVFKHLLCYAYNFSARRDADERHAGSERA